MSTFVYLFVNMELYIYLFAIDQYQYFKNYNEINMLIYFFEFFFNIFFGGGGGGLIYVLHVYRFYLQSNFLKNTLF